jgi:hypothetical protein
MQKLPTGIGQTGWRVIGHQVLPSVDGTKHNERDRNRFPADREFVRDFLSAHRMKRASRQNIARWVGPGHQAGLASLQQSKSTQRAAWGCSPHLQGERTKELLA